MFNIGAGEMTFILVVALLVLGPKRLPELARGIGKALREFRRHTEDVRTVVEREFYRMDHELEAEPAPALHAPEHAVSTPGVSAAPDTVPLEPDLTTAHHPPEPLASVAPEVERSEGDHAPAAPASEKQTG